MSKCKWIIKALVMAACAQIIAKFICVAIGMPNSLSIFLPTVAFMTVLKVYLDKQRNKEFREAIEKFKKQLRK